MNINMNMGVRLCFVALLFLPVALFAQKESSKKGDALMTVASLGTSAQQGILKILDGRSRFFQERYLLLYKLEQGFESSEIDEALSERLQNEELGAISIENFLRIFEKDILAFQSDLATVIGGNKAMRAEVFHLDIYANYLLSKIYDIWFFSLGKHKPKLEKTHKNIMEAMTEDVYSSEKSWRKCCKRLLSDSYAFYGYTLLRLTQLTKKKVISYGGEAEIVLSKALRLWKENHRAQQSLVLFYLGSPVKTIENWGGSRIMLTKMLGAPQVLMHFYAHTLYSQFYLLRYQPEKAKAALAEAEKIYPESLYLIFLRSKFLNKETIFDL